MPDRKNTGLEPPAPPSATRLNKLAVIVAASVMSLTLLVVTLMVGRSSKEDVQERAQREEQARLPRGPARPGFLDRPPQEAPAEDPLSGESLTQDPFAGDADPPLDPYAGLKGPGAEAPYVPPELYEAAPYYEAPAYGEQPARQPSPEEQALERAMRSSLVPQGLGGRAARRDEPNLDEDQAAGYEEDDLLSTLSDVQRVLGVGGQGAAVPSIAGAEAGDREASPAGQPRPIGSEAFIQQAAQARQGTSNYIATEIERPASRFEVREGTLVEAFLITGIHSDLPGEVVAQVARHVYDSGTQQALLIPKGTRLIGTYDNQVALDQSRLLVAWTRMIFPDGRSVRLPGLASKDTQGASGLTGRVNRHYWRAFGNALMLSVVGAGLGLAQRRPDPGGFGSAAYPTPGEVMAGSVATELSRVATEILRSNVNRRPTIEIEEGTAFNIFVSGDLALPPYRPQDGFLRP